MLVRRNCLRGRRWAAVAVASGMLLWGPLSWAADRVEALRARLAQQPGRPETIAVLADLFLREDLIAPSRMAETLRDLVDGKAAAKTDPLVLAHATYRLSLLEDKLGRFAEAEDLRKRLGLVGNT